MHLVAALELLAPGAQWILDGDDLGGLTWLDEVVSRPADADLLAKMAEDLPPSPDYPAFRHAIAQLPAWRSLIATDGRAVELSRCLGEQDLTTATIWWDDLVEAANDGQDSKISPELKADILAAAIAANMPQALLDKLQ